ncbi:MAG: hypothetical protein SF028_00625 [Candidatus Sumerlaeia bacterium]|nr:hypothetical protein [Candidatus Sumerlaeia bacterium]
MISADSCWRFIEPLGDAGHFEDEIVEHMGTLHRARRRAFTDKVSRDEVLLGEILRQSSMLATRPHPALPRLYGGELVDNRYTLIYELMGGKPLLDRAAKGEYQAVSAWCDMALRVAQSVKELEALGVDFSRLQTRQIMMGRRGRIRFSVAWPIGRVTRAALEKSESLNRILRSSAGGVFLVEGSADSAAGVRGLQPVLFHLARGTDQKSIEDAILADDREKMQKGVRELPSVLGVDREIGQIILRMQEPSGDIVSVPQLLTVLRSLKTRAEDADRERLATNPSTAAVSASVSRVNVPKMPGPAILPAGGSAPSRSNEPSANDPSFAPSFEAAFKSIPQRPPSSPTVQRPANRESDGPGTLKARPQRIDEVPADKPAYAKVEKEFSESDDPSDYLYPKRPDVVESAPAAAPGTGELPIPQPVRVKDLPKARSPKREAQVRAAVYLVVVLAILGGLAYGGLHLASLMRVEANTPPTARIADHQGSVAAVQRVTLDGTGSTDPEGKALVYNWRIVEPEGAEFRFSGNNSTAASRIEAQFFTVGRVVVELKVFDGTFNSEPARTVFEVSPAERGR